MDMSVDDRESHAVETETVVCPRSVVEEEFVIDGVVGMESVIVDDRWSDVRMGSGSASMSDDDDGVESLDLFDLYHVSSFDVCRRAFCCDACLRPSV